MCSGTIFGGNLRKSVEKAMSSAGTLGNSLRACAAMDCMRATMYVLFRTGKKSLSHEPQATGPIVRTERGAHLNLRNVIPTFLNVGPIALRSMVPERPCLHLASLRATRSAIAPVTSIHVFTMGFYRTLRLPELRFRAP